MEATDVTERELKPAMGRGLRGRCPSCGEGKLMKTYLKVADACNCCGQSFSHQRADDGPAYFTILIVGHVAGFVLHGLFSWTDMGPLTMFAVTGLACIVAALLMLPRIKGAMVGWQWAQRLHGF